MSNSEPVSVSEQLPAGGSPQAPSSGTYGEDAALSRLQSQLPGEGAPDQASGVAPIPPMGGAPPISPPSGGLPKSMFAPTAQPGVPASMPMTPMTEEPSAPTPNVISALQALATDPERRVSRTTRLWAQMLLEGLET